MRHEEPSSRPLGGRGVQLAAVIVFFILYSLLSHYSNSNPQARDLGAALALAPVLVIGFVLIWRGVGAMPAVLAAVAAGLLVLAYWPLLSRNFSVVYLAQQCGFYLIMALTFGVSLLPGRVPLCTQLADRVHGPLSPRELRYTRSVTVAWVIFFVLNLALTCVLFGLAPLRIWSIFVNFCSLPLILAMFVGEYAVRRRALPELKRSGLIATLRVYFVNSPKGS